MNLMNPEFAMPDVQSTVDTRQMPIQRVGVRAVRHPLTVRTAEGETQATVGTWNLDVHLPADQKGTHMSRFVALLEERGGPLTADAFRTMLATMLEKLEARAGRIEVSFPYFVNKTAPVSGVRSLLDYEVTLTGDVRDGLTRVFAKVLVPVTSLCPCSKKISQYGAHNQRSHVTIDAELAADVPVRRSDPDRGGRGLVRAMGPPEASRREVRHRARVRESEVRRGSGARRRAAARCGRADRRLCARGGEFRVDPQSQRVRADRARQAARRVSAAVARRRSPYSRKGPFESNGLFRLGVAAVRVGSARPPQPGCGLGVQAIDCAAGDRVRRRSSPTRVSGEHDVRRQVPNGSRGRAARSRRLRALAFVPGIGRAREQARARCGLGSAARRAGSVWRARRASRAIARATRDPSAASP